MKRISKKKFERLEELAGYANELAKMLRDIHGDADCYMDERSDRWRESDRGGEYEEWVELLDEAADAAQAAAESADNLQQSPSE